MGGMGCFSWGCVMRRFAPCLLLCLVAAAPAVADPYGQATTKYVGVGPAQTIRINETDLGVSNLNVYVGVSKLQVSGYIDNAGNPVSVPGGGSQFDGTTIAGFCIDIDDSVRSGNVFDVHVKPLDESPDPFAGPMLGEKASQVAWLLDNNSWSLTMAAADAAAMQLAIWEVVHEGSGAYNVGSGDFYATSWSNTAVQSAAQGLLGDMLTGWTSGYSFANYVGLSSPLVGTEGKQDFVVKVVPVPGAVLLGILGLGAAGMRLRRSVG